MINYKMLIDHLEKSPILYYSVKQVAMILNKTRGTIYIYCNVGYTTYDDEVIKLEKSGTKITNQQLITFLKKINDAEKRRYHGATL
jgi:hypothetical protein